MASHGAMKEVATAEPPRKKLPPKELEHIRLTAAENGGVVAEHHHTHYEHPPEKHVFADGDGHKLAAHIEKHLGIKMPGKSSADGAQPREGDENEGKD